MLLVCTVCHTCLRGCSNCAGLLVNTLSMCTARHTCQKGVAVEFCWIASQHTLGSHCMSNMTEGLQLMLLDRWDRESAKSAMHECRWGHVLAEGAFGKGHGSRAFLHALRNSFVMHDASYMCPIELTGPFEAVSAVLQDVRCDFINCYWATCCPFSWHLHISFFKAAGHCASFQFTATFIFA